MGKGEQVISFLGSVTIGVILYFNYYYILSCLSLFIALCCTHSITFGLLKHPHEIWFMFLYLISKTPQIPTNVTADQRYSYVKLTQTSRSFSAGILGLTEEFRYAIMIFYLVLRALDTIEDDMKPSVDSKVKNLTTFHEHLTEPGWTLSGFGDKKYEIELLENFDKVISSFAQLKPEYQVIIKDVCKKMGGGMAEFLTRKVDTLEDWDLYCWYVAGLVGEGLSRIFSASKLEDPVIGENKKLYKSMGLFLQKTNIIRDYLEDINECPPRVFYPKAAWSKWANDITDFKDPKNINAAVNCLNELITNALRHASDCIDYLEVLRDPTVFKFCAIPQVMAIATLYECYNNPQVFKKEVKIRKSLAVKMILQSTSLPRVLDFFLQFVEKFKSAVDPSHPNAKELNQILSDLHSKITNKLSHK